MGTIRSLFKALKSFWVFKAPLAGRRLRGGFLGDESEFLLCIFAFGALRKPFKAHQFSFLLWTSRKDQGEKIPFL